MSTGHSRAVEGGRAKTYHGFGKDVEQVTELIRLWCTREDRWMSPKYIIGESYGTVRAVAVAQRLQQKHALMLNGMVLVSSVLDFGTQDFSHHRWDEACVNFLPTYTAVAHYHGKVKGRLGRVRQEAEEFAAGPYRSALAAGRRLPAKDRANVVRTLARLTGLSEEYVERTDLRIEHWRFCTELLRDRGLSVGRIDGRFTGPARSLIAENMDADPSMDAMNGPFAAALHHYLRSELGNARDLPYEVYANAITKWSFEEFEGKPIFVADQLERVMRANPHLRVRIEYGYYDLATPYHAAEDMVAHLRLPAEAFDRIEHEYFETGHMPYLHESSRKRELASIAAFVERG
jgi:carboxypeptidase C (cathepsin A)